MGLNEVDVVVVGSGAGGAPMALQLGRAGFKVVLLDSSIEQIDGKSPYVVDAGNCVAQIQANGYAFPPAAPCSSCRDNNLSLEGKCKAMIDCLESRFPCTSSTCNSQCLNNVGGSSVVDTCAKALTNAACR